MWPKKLTQQKKIAIVVTSVLMVRFFLVPHLRELAKRYDVTLILKNDEPVILANMDLPVRLIIIPIERKISLWRDIHALFRLLLIFWREKFDLIHTLTPKAGLLGIVAAWMTAAPVRIHTFQGEIWANKTGFWRWLLRSLDILVARLATHLTVVSESERLYLIDEDIISAEKSCVLEKGSIGGVDLDRFRRNEDLRQKLRAEFSVDDQGMLFLYLGRLTEDKGLLELGSAFRRLAQERGDVHLLIVGPDEDGIREKLECSLHEFKHRVIFKPYTERPEDVMAAADILVLPSHREGFGVVIIEAAAAGVPAIGTNVYGITDAIVDGETGVLFEKGDVTDLGDKMNLLAADPQLRKYFGEQAYRRAVQDFDQRNVVKAFSGYYSNLIG